MKTMKIKVLLKSKIHMQYEIKMPEGVKDCTVIHNLGSAPKITLGSVPPDSWRIIENTENLTEIVRAHNDSDSTIFLSLTIKNKPKEKMRFADMARRVLRDIEQIEQTTDVFNKFVSECGSCKKYKECINEPSSGSCPSTVSR